MTDEDEMKCAQRATVVSFRNAFLSENFFCRSVIDCCASDAAAIDNGSDGELMAGLASVREFD